MLELEKELFQLQDLDYRDFHSKLMPGIDKNNIIGIRIPVLRAFAKRFEKTEAAKEFINVLPHRYYEEDNLHMMIITGIKDYEKCIYEIERFLPYINNWSTCDTPLPKCFKTNKENLLIHVKKWIASHEVYSIRYGIGVLMRMYLDEDFKPEYLELVSDVKSEEYYVNMMIAWYMATALAKQWNESIVYIEQHRLSQWVHKKTIQKAIENYRITEEQKEYLRSLKLN